MTDPTPHRSLFATGSALARNFAPGDCREPAIARLYAYWLQQRGERRFPGRQDVDPLDMRFALGGITLFDVVRAPERTDGYRFRYRLIGSDIVARDGFDLTGRWLDDLPLVQYRDLITSRLVGLMADPAPLLVHNRQFYDGRWYDYEAIWLPFAADHVQVDMMMACQIFADTPSSHQGLPVA